MKTKALDHEAEVLAAVGGEDEKTARKALIESQKEEDAALAGQHADEQTMLNDAKRVVTYNGLLAKFLIRRISLVNFPMGWTYRVAPTDKGIILEMQSADGRFFRSAFRTTGLQKYDLNAIEVYAHRVENTIERATYRKVPTEGIL